MPDGEVIDGSPLIAAKASPPFTHLFWVDSDTRNAASLRAHQADFPRRRITVLQEDANRAVDDILRVVPRDRPVFAFLDPEGSELAWSTIEKLARHKRRNKIELFLLFAYNMAVVRLMPHDPTKLAHSDRLDQLMPNPGVWRRIYGQRASSSPDEYRRLVLNEYLDGLRSLGYRHVLRPRLIPTPSRRPLYFMIFATDHDAGLSIMDYAFNRVEQTVTQPSLLPYDQRY